MQSLIKKVKKLRLLIIENQFRYEVKLNLDKPTISFTFDDFPKTAFTIDVKILEKHNAKGTYYAAFGLIDSVYEIGEILCKRCY